MSGRITIGAVPNYLAQSRIVEWLGGQLSLQEVAGLNLAEAFSWKGPTERTAPNGSY